jgi:DNA primase
VALCGVAANKDLGDLLQKVALKYVALDNDKAGRDALVTVAQTFGPMTRLLKWERQDRPVAAATQDDLGEDEQELPDTAEVSNGEG